MASHDTVPWWLMSFGGCAPGAHGVISARTTESVVLTARFRESSLWQSRQYFSARARRRSILSWRRHSSPQKHEPRATLFSEICILHRTQKRSILGMARTSQFIPVAFSVLAPKCCRCCFRLLVVSALCPISFRVSRYRNPNMKNHCFHLNAMVNDDPAIDVDTVVAGV